MVRERIGIHPRMTDAKQYSHDTWLSFRNICYIEYDYYGFLSKAARCLPTLVMMLLISFIATFKLRGFMTDPFKLGAMTPG